jgi:hypothetical protein
MQHDELVIAARHDILLEEIGAHLECQGLCRQRVLRQVAGGATMSNNQRLGHESSISPSASNPGKSITSHRAVSSPRP